MRRSSVRKRLYFGKDAPLTSEKKLSLQDTVPFTEITNKNYKLIDCHVKLTKVSDILLRNIVANQKADTTAAECNDTSSGKTDTNKIVDIQKSIPNSDTSSVSETDLGDQTDSSLIWEKVLYKYPLETFSTNKVKLPEESLVQPEIINTADANNLEDTGFDSDDYLNSYSPKTGCDPNANLSQKTAELESRDDVDITSNSVENCLQALPNSNPCTPHKKASQKKEDIQGNKVFLRSPETPSNSNKKEFCIFCNDTKTNLVRHFKTVHRDEEEVNQFLQLDERSIERSAIINKLKSKICNDNYLTHVPQEKEVKGAEKNKYKKNYSKKREFCIFCEEIKTNMARHFELCHQDEEKVIKFLQFEKGSRQRAELISKLRNEGNFKHNLANPEKLILVRRRHVYGDPENPKKYFLPCSSCKAFFSYRHLPKHYQICCKVPTQKGTTRGVTRDARALTNNIHCIANDILKYKIIPPMRNDSIFEILKNDRLILLFGNHLTPKYIAHQEYIIRQRLRFLGRYLIIVKQINSDIKKLEHLFRPRHFETALKAVCQLAEVSNTTGAFIKPKLALEMVQCLKMCSKILESTYIKEGNDKRRKNVNKFFKLLESESASRINKPAHRDLIASSRQNKIKKQGNLPLSDDITRFKFFLLNRAETLYQNLLDTQFSHVLWRGLAELTLLYIVVYNRKRSGESHRILVEDFLNIHPLTNCAMPEEIESLESLDKEKAKITYKIIIRGKLNHTICAFIPQNVKLFLDYIYEHRADAKVPDDNPYLFGLPGKLSGLRHKTLETCFLMRKYTPMAKLRNPQHLRTTLLRKHLATKVSTLHLEDAQQETVHDFMGHHGNIHKGFYRQQIISKDLMINKLLDQDIHLDTAPSTAERRKLNKNDKMKRKRNMLEEIKNNNKCSRAITTAESSVDTENETVYKRNLRIIQTTPARSKGCRRNYSPKQRRILSISDNEEPDDPYAASDSDDPSVKSIDLVNSDEDEVEIESDDVNYKGKNIQKKKDKRITITKQRWRTPQKKVLYKLFGTYIKQGIYPPGPKIQETINRYKVLADRTVATTKSFLQHEMKKNSCSSDF